MVDPLYRSLNFLRLRNYTKCAEACKSISSKKQKEKWYIICKARIEESWTDFTEPDELPASDYIFDENLISELPRPGTSLQSTRSTRGNLPISSNGKPITGYSHSRNINTSLGLTPTTSSTSHFSRLATASLSFNGDEPDVTSINVIQISKHPFLSRILMDYLLYRLRDPIRSISIASECTKANLYEDWWWKQRLGRCYYLVNLYTESESQFLSSLRITPNINTRLELCKLYYRLNQPLKSLNEIDEGIEQFPQEIKFLLWKARLLNDLNNTSDSRDIWKKVLSIDPTNVEAISSLGYLTFYEDQPETSFVFYNYLRKIGISNYILFNNIAMSALSSGNYDIVGPAIVNALVLTESQEQKADVWYNISHVAMNSGDLNLMQQALEIATALSPNTSAEAFNNLGLLEIKRRNVQRSLAAFRAAIEANPNMHEAWFNIALVYQRIGQMQEAYYAAKMAVKLCPQLLDAVELENSIKDKLR
ncbi:tetratricopeptide repeat protein 8 [Histomonas meleagridis]|uniref:tetratricopeptide repeat protein 8 n=1 Tax=Histomonas meleagridis TaxID=135588 RepID=UPI0035595A1C|nr:tetratricopeptide repeat protein 8 [Histomonas meleagridis]KAH0801565.1 tetratricopeptide repeat protein 8 [Histomonas meleagridis]